jgi:hypothetical protein
MSKKTVEIYLRSLTVKQNGVTRGKKKGSNILSVSMFYADYPEAPITRDYKLSNGETINFDTDEKSPGVPYPEFDKLLFKKEINHYVWLRVYLVHIVEPKFLDSLLNKFYKAAFGGVSVLVSNSILEIPFNAGTGEISRRLGKGKKKVIVIGEADIKIETEKLNHPVNEIISSLKIPNTVTKVSRKKDVHTGEIIRKVEPYLIKGTGNGEVVLTVKVL